MHEWLLPSAFVTGLLFGIVISYGLGRKQGYDRGYENGRSGR